MAPPYKPDMLKWALILAAIALMTGLFGFSGFLAGAAGMVRLLFCVFLVLFVAVLLFGMVNTEPGERSIE